jgi:hypothetical protein
MGPLAQRAKSLVEVSPRLGQCVFDADRRARKDASRDQAGSLELAEAVGAKALRHAGNRADQRMEANRAAQQDAQDRPGPALADQLDCLVVYSADASGIVVLIGRGRCCRVRRKCHSEIIPRPRTLDIVTYYQ